MPVQLSCIYIVHKLEECSLSSLISLIYACALKAHENIAKHYDWVQTFIGKYDINADNVHKILQDEIGDVFAKILECAGVYKRDDAGKAAFLRFVDYVNAK